MIKFGTGGFRAIIGEEFTKDSVEKIASGLLSKIKKEKLEAHDVVVGYDRRFLSHSAAVWLSEVLAGGGVKVELCKTEVPSPLVMFLCKEKNLPYGVMITASHNPYMYNGIKIFTYGKDANVSVTKDLEDKIAKVTTVTKLEYHRALETGMIKIIDARDEYVGAILKFVSPKKTRTKLKVLFDPMFGVAGDTMEKVLIPFHLKKLKIINNTHDAYFGFKMPSPNIETIKDLQVMVVKEKFDIALATDGDGDRIGIVDRKGNFVDCNYILALLYKYFLTFKGLNGDIVKNTATSSVLDKLARFYGKTCYEVPVGFKHISQTILDTNCIIGGESSGGVAVKGYILGKDSIFTAALVIDMLVNLKRPIDVLIDELKKQLDFNMVIKDREYRLTAESRTRIEKVLSDEKSLPKFGKKIDKVSAMDGVKVFFEDGSWALIRFSGTEPLLRLFVEMQNENEANEMLGFLEKFLKIK